MTDKELRRKIVAFTFQAMKMHPKPDRLDWTYFADKCLLERTLENSQRIVDAMIAGERRGHVLAAVSRPINGPVGCVITDITAYGEDEVERWEAEDANEAR